MSEVFTPLGVKISLPSLRITEMLKKIPALLAEGRRGRPDAGPRGRPRRHARADPQADRQPGPLRRLPPRRSAAAGGRSSSTSCAACPASGTADLDGIVAMAETDRPDRQGSDRPLCRGHGQRLQLHPQAAHALPVERDADARVLPLGTQVPPVQGQDPFGDGQVPRHRAEHARRHPDPRRPPRRRRAWKKPGAAGPGSTPGPSTSTPSSGGTPSPTSASTSRSTASASGPSRKSSPGTISTIKYGRDYLAKEQTRSVVQLEAMAGAV